MTSVIVRLLAVRAHRDRWRVPCTFPLLPIPRTIVINQSGQIIARLDPDATVEQVEELVKSLVE